MSSAATSTAVSEDDAIRDPERLQEIARLDLFSDEVQSILDDQAEKAAEALDLPLGFVSLVLDEAQYMAGKHGDFPEWVEKANGSPVEWSYCQYAVKDEDDVVIEDATTDERTKDSPFAQEEGLHCYAGIPLETSRGYIIGSFCASGTEERSFEEEELEVMRELADQTMEMIERHADAS
jgi:GAF domain-containing protein